ncbi:MAG: zinc ABC transporter substrate-binding protein [Phycisphaeraceae bacterium]|nr:zinc ABC transporter substrate-binding protein [Phycisphaeraceae bacterium]
MISASQTAVGPSFIRPVIRHATLITPASSLLLCLLTLAIPACEKAPPPSSSAQLRVVVTHSILSDVVANVGQDHLHLTTFVGPNGDAHTYEPTPRDLIALADAAVLIENGLQFEPWVDKLYESSGSKAVRVVASQGIQPRTLNEDGHEETDPHCWQSVPNVIAMTQTIAAALAAADPAHAESYRANAQAYQTQLQELDRYIQEKVSTLPAESRVIVTSHDSLGYFAQRYGFTVLGTPLASLTTEAGDPSAQKIAAVVQEIRHAQVPAVFIENMQNPKLMAQIAAEAGVRFDSTLYTDSLDQPGSPGETYLKMMHYNADTIVESLK